MSVQELENEVKRLPFDDRRKFMMEMFCDCCQEIMDDTDFKDQCIHTLGDKGVDLKEIMTRCG
jgi:hypothetical protein